MLISVSHWGMVETDRSARAGELGHNTYPYAELANRINPREARYIATLIQGHCMDAGLKLARVSEGR